MDAVCSHCKKVGHLLASVGPKHGKQLNPGTPGPRKKQRNLRHQHVQTTSKTRSLLLQENTMYQICDNHTEPYVLDITLNNVPVKMEFDIGAAVSVISESTYRKITSNLPTSAFAPILETRFGCWVLQKSK